MKKVVFFFKDIALALLIAFILFLLLIKNYVWDEFIADKIEDYKFKKIGIKTVKKGES